jgi:hypothetical protein
MSYSSIVEMANSESLRSRITAAAAAQEVPNPDQWIYGVAWQVAASPGWDTKWDSAKSSYNINENPDVGARTDVISDADILAAITAIISPSSAPA